MSREVESREDVGGITIPYGIDKETREKITPDKATKEHKNQYICPLCEERLVLRKGEIRVPHFAHYSGHSCGETQEHYDAKLLLKEVLSGEREPLEVLIARVYECKTAHYDTEWIGPEWGYPEHENTISLPSGEKLRIDMVACKLDGTPNVLFEVAHTNPLTEEKIKKLNSTGFQWIEFDTRKLLKGTSGPILPRNTSRKKKKGGPCNDPEHQEILSPFSVPVEVKPELLRWWDGRGGKMSWWEATRIHWKAQKLLEYGFTQDPSESYKFRIKEKGRVYLADFGGSTKRTVSSGWRPTLYAPGLKASTAEPELSQLKEQVEGATGVEFYTGAKRTNLGKRDEK